MGAKRSLPGWGRGTGLFTGCQALRSSSTSLWLGAGRHALSSREGSEPPQGQTLYPAPHLGLSSPMGLTTSIPESPRRGPMAPVPGQERVRSRWTGHRHRQFSGSWQHSPSHQKTKGPH